MDHKVVPPKIADRGFWIQNRRSFVKNTLIFTAMSSAVLWQSCGDHEIDILPLSHKQFNLIKEIQNILFPSDGNGPGAKEVHADRYIIWMLNDSRLDQEEMKFLISGMNWVEEESEKVFNKSFSKLEQIEKQNLIQIISKESWGESWLSVNLTYIFEALLSDPIYGFNSDEQGWKWLEHLPGDPRPVEHNRYDQIFEVLNF